MIYHNSYDQDCRVPFGAAEISSKVRLTVTADYACGATLRTWTDEHGEATYKMEHTQGDDFSIEITMPDYGTLLWYYFIIQYPSGDTCMYGAPSDHQGGIGQEYQNNPESFQITVYKPTTTPEWYKKGIMYQIFPDRFFRGSDFEERAKKSGKIIVDDWYEKPYYIKNDAGDVTEWRFHGGTLKGIEEKLSYLKELGVTTLYLNPIFKAKSNHRYDTADYMAIDPLLGDEESFKSLCEKAKALDIHIIFDGVFSHTGKDSIYFEEGSKYREWFQFNEDGSYKCWWGVKDLPEVDETNPSYIEYICGEQGVINKWINLGASGIRLDVADELPDSFIKEVRKRLKNENSDSVLIGEVWEDASNKFSHGERRKYLMGEELDSTMNYPIRDILIDFAQNKCDGFLTARRIMHLMENYPIELLISTMNLLGSHDRERILTIMDSNKEMVKMLYALMFFLPGVPCIYYGDETSLEGETDPENRGSYPWGKEDQDTIKFFKDLAKIYNSHSALKDGNFIPYFLHNDVLSFTRQNEEEKILVLANRSDQDITVYLEGKEYELPAFRTICEAL